MSVLGYLTLAYHSRRPLLVIQLLVTIAILAWVPTNPLKLAAMLLVWRFGFGPIARAELLAMAAVNLLFILMNSAALKRGIFVFDHPDMLRMPVYEFLMWGFYTLHTIRFLGGPAPANQWLLVLAAATGFALPFATIADATLLFAVSGSVVLACLIAFRQPMDLAYAAYMAGVGALIEYVGAGTGQWHYPQQHYGGVPLWFLTMWAGVGLFTRRLVLPLLPQSQSQNA